MTSELEGIAKLDTPIVVELGPFGNLYKKTDRSGTWNKYMVAHRHLIIAVMMRGWWSHISLEREEGECELEQSISVFCKYPEHIWEEHIWRK